VNDSHDARAQRSMRRKRRRTDDAGRVKILARSLAAGPVRRTCGIGRRRRFHMSSASRRLALKLRRPPQIAVARVPCDRPCRVLDGCGGVRAQLVQRTSRRTLCRVCSGSGGARAAATYKPAGAAGARRRGGWRRVVVVVAVHRGMTGDE
jgi:hypothetical protein